VIKPLKNLVRSGLGGKQGRGKQMFSWIHIEDLYGIINFIQQHSEISGAVNTAAPNPVNNKTLMQLTRKMMGVRLGLPMPAWLLKFGAVIIRTETELILKSRWVIPERLLKAGFQFKFANIEQALENILIDKPTGSNR
jgi:NAD dependent epimerase/dehydratase family enzyme